MSTSTVELLDKSITHIIAFLETDQLFSLEIIPIYIPTKHIIFPSSSIISATFAFVRPLNFLIYMCDIFHYDFLHF